MECDIFGLHLANFDHKRWARDFGNDCNVYSGKKSYFNSFLSMSRHTVEVKVPIVRMMRSHATYSRANAIHYVDIAFQIDSCAGGVAHDTNFTPLLEWHPKRIREHYECIRSQTRRMKLNPRSAPRSHDTLTLEHGCALRSEGKCLRGGQWLVLNACGSTLEIVIAVSCIRLGKRRVG